MKHRKKRTAIFMCGHLIDLHSCPSFKVDSGVKKNNKVIDIVVKTPNASCFKKEFFSMYTLIQPPSLNCAKHCDCSVWKLAAGV